MKYLKKIRKENGYSCQNMADKLKISKPYYWQIEKGMRRLSYEMALKIANIFDMRPDDVFYNDFKFKEKKEK